jgi:CBS domain-containing protein
MAGCNDHAEVNIVVVARDLMTPGARSVPTTSTLVEAARLMRELNVGSLPICGRDNRLEGVLTDRDIVVSCIADGGDPASTTAADLAHGTPVTIDADEAAENALLLMAQYQVRRLPVIEGDRLVGMLSQADVAGALPEQSVGAAVRGISDS